LKSEEPVILFFNKHNKYRASDPHGNHRVGTKFSFYKQFYYKYLTVTFNPILNY